jgi:hypothetical protein
MLNERRFLYSKNSVDGNSELDYINTAIIDMDLTYTEKFVVNQTLQFRIDLISYRFYNTFDLGWLICDYNNIMDPFDEIVVGKELLIPDLGEYYSFFNANSVVR